LKLQYYIKLFWEGFVNSYSQIFFSNNKILAYILLLVSFFDIGAGLSGVIAILIGQITCVLFNFSHALLRDGTYTYNSLMVGLAIGMFYDFNLSFFILLLVISFLTLFITIWFSVSLGKRGLPMLSIPFLLGLWIIILGVDNFSALELKQKEILSLAKYFPELFTGVTDFIGELPFANVIYLYLRSLGAIFFQFNDLAGLLTAIAILIYSRIGFLLSIFGFLIGYTFYYYLEGDFSQLIYSYIGFNFILTAIALGGFFVIPSRKSFLMLLLTIPIIAILISALHTLFTQFGLPLFSLPFNIVVLLFLSAMMTRFKTAGLTLVTLQQFSPEKNHYKFANAVDRFSSDTYYHISLPIMGDWRVSQGYDGNITHKGEWGQALDFDIINNEGETYKLPGLELKDYYCYDIPVLAPAGGVVVEIIDNIEDNKIGDVNLENNWGNSVVIKHGDYLFSKLSHLKIHTIQVKKGDYIKKGKIIGYCGSSGRSPEPHIHFQMQTTPYVGSKTLAHPISYYLTKKEGKHQFHAFDIPEEGQVVSNVTTTPLLEDAFHLIPGMKLEFENEETGEEVSWEVFVSATNQTYLYCAKTKSTAYFVNNGTMFYFTDYYGNKKALLHSFYIGAHKVLLGYYKELNLEDNLMIQGFFSPFVTFFHDFTAPFFHYCKAKYQFRFTKIDNEHKPTEIEFTTESKGILFGKESNEFEAKFLVTKNKITTIEFKSKKQEIRLKCKD